MLRKSKHFTEKVVYPSHISVGSLFPRLTKHTFKKNFIPLETAKGGREGRALGSKGSN